MICTNLMPDSSTSLIIGVNGQDGIFLSRLLCGLGNTVIGVGNSPNPNTYLSSKVKYHKCDFRDTTKIIDLVIKNQIYEIYNLATISSVFQSFLGPESPLEFNFNAVNRQLKGLYLSNSNSHIRFFQASSSEMFGIANIEPQNEEFPFNPVSPYAVSKVKAFEACLRYQELGFYVSSAIMYNQ